MIRKIKYHLRFPIKLLLLKCIILISISAYSQQTNYDSTKVDNLKLQIKKLESTIPWLSEKVNISVTDIPVTEFIRAVANSTKANISVDPGINQMVVNNFSDVKVSDLLLFLRDQFRLDISIVGNIVVVKAMPAIEARKQFDVTYSSDEGLISIDAVDISLSDLAKRITMETGQNIVIQSGLKEQKITSYLLRLPVDIAIKELANSNNLELDEKDNAVFFVRPKIESIPVTRNEVSNNQPQSKVKKNDTYILSVKILGPDSLMLIAEDAPIVEIIKELSTQSGNNYILSVPLDELISLQIDGSTYFDILSNLLTGTKATFKLDGGIYLIGDNESSDLMKQEIIQLQYRTVDSILSVVPNDLLLSLETYIFREQNSIMLSGPTDKVDRTIKILKEVDRLVPVISIEVMIIDYNKTFTIKTGIQAGLTNEPIPQTNGKVLPSIDINLDSYSINDLINRFNGYGWAKIGKVTPNFYMNIHAMENQGILEIRSTPILSTLNGHKAELTIGNTEYYLEEQLNIIGTQNPQSQTIQTYKPIEAELSVVITPIVSGDDQITLDIEVTQSDFTERLSTTAPPGKVQRTFKSKIRVRNEEMILLGGLEENRNSKTSSGTPLLSKIPILKWLFSNRTEETSKSKLNIFIKPTIIS